MSPYRVATKTIFTRSACEVIVMADSQADAEAKFARPELWDRDDETGYYLD